MVSSANYLKTNTAIRRFYHKNAKDLPVQLLRIQACRDLKSRIYLISLFAQFLEGFVVEIDLVTSVLFGLIHRKVGFFEQHRAVFVCIIPKNSASNTRS